MINFTAVCLCDVPVFPIVISYVVQDSQRNRWSVLIVPATQRTQNGRCATTLLRGFNRQKRRRTRHIRSGPHRIVPVSTASSNISLCDTICTRQKQLAPNALLLPSIVMGRRTSLFAGGCRGPQNPRVHPDERRLDSPFDFRTKVVPTVRNSSYCIQVHLDHPPPTPLGRKQYGRATAICVTVSSS